jgi:hypothetical protein
MKYGGDSTHGVAKKKTKKNKQLTNKPTNKNGKTLGKASGFTAFCNPWVESPYISWLLIKESYNTLVILLQFT